MHQSNWLSKTPTRRRRDAAKLSDAGGLLSPPCGLPADAWPSRVAGVSQVRHPSWKWSASGTDASRLASNTSFKSSSSLVRAWSLCAVRQRAAADVFDLHARDALQRCSTLTWCARIGWLHQRQRQHDVGHRQDRPCSALRAAAGARLPPAIVASDGWRLILGLASCGCSCLVLVVLPRVGQLRGAGVRLGPHRSRVWYKT